MKKFQLFLLNLNFLAKTKKLKNAELYAFVSYPKTENTITNAVVAVGSSGHYQVSWTLPNKLAHSGEYKLKVYRQVDRRRGVSVEPFINITHTHETPMISILPFRTEFLALLIFGVGFMMASLRKNSIQGTRKLKGKPDPDWW